MADLQAAKALVLKANAAMDDADASDAHAALTPYVSDEYLWRGMHPFHQQSGAQAVADVFWSPLKSSLGRMQRRMDVFFAGLNQLDGWHSLWVCEMGHLMCLWDRPWLGIAPSQKLGFLRYAAFHRIDGDRIVETAMYVDILNFLAQAGHQTVPSVTGLETLSPGPRTQDGLIFDAQDPKEGRKTIELVSDMVTDLRAHAVSSPGDHMDRFWTDDMTWFGPGGIGASAFRRGYRRGHSGPFEQGLTYVRHTEHVTRIGEGMYGAFFGYPSLTMTSQGYMGMPPSEVPADMRIVDVYRRAGEKLAENWIFIDLPHFFAMQGHDLLAR